MKKIYTLIILLVLTSFQLKAQLQLVNLEKLDESFITHQSGQIPVFKSLMLRQGPTEPKLILDPSSPLELRDSRNLIAVVDQQLVVF